VYKRISLNHLVRLPGTKVRRVDLPTRTDGCVVIHAESTERPADCGEKGCKVESRGEPRIITIKDTRIAGYQAKFKIKYHRFRCTTHKKELKAPIRGIDCWETGRPNPAGDSPSRHAITARLLEEVAQATRNGAFSDVGTYFGLDEKIVASIFRRHAEAADRLYRFEAPTFLGIDEVHIRTSADKRREHVVFTNLKNGNVIEIIETKSTENVAAYLFMMQNPKRLSCVVMDQCDEYRLAVKSIFPNVPIVLDRYHVIKEVRKTLHTLHNNIRIKNQGKNDKDYRDEAELLNLRASALDLDKNKKYKRILYERWNNTIMAEAFHLVEQFCRIYDRGTRSRTTDEAKTYWEAWKEMSSPELSQHFAKVIKELEGWREEFFAYFSFSDKKTNSFAENNNKKIKRINSEGNTIPFDLLRQRTLARLGGRSFSTFERLEAEHKEEDNAPSITLEQARAEADSLVKKCKRMRGAARKRSSRNGKGTSKTRARSARAPAAASDPIALPEGEDRPADVRRSHPAP
jgi:transposase